MVIADLIRLANRLLLGCVRLADQVIGRSPHVSVDISVTKHEDDFTDESGNE